MIEQTRVKGRTINAGCHNYQSVVLSLSTGFTGRVEKFIVLPITTVIFYTAQLYFNLVLIHSVFNIVPSMFI